MPQHDPWCAICGGPIRVDFIDYVGRIKEIYTKSGKLKAEYKDLGRYDFAPWDKSDEIKDKKQYEWINNLIVLTKDNVYHSKDSKHNIHIETEEMSIDNDGYGILFDYDSYLHYTSVVE